MDIAQLGAALRQAHLSKKITQSVLSTQLSMSRATLSGIENGQNANVGLRTLLSLCATLNLELNIQAKKGRPTYAAGSAEECVAEYTSPNC